MVEDWLRLASRPSWTRRDRKPKFKPETLEVGLDGLDDLINFFARDGSDWTAASVAARDRNLVLRVPELFPI